MPKFNKKLIFIALPTMLLAACSSFKHKPQMNTEMKSDNKIVPTPALNNTVHFAFDSFSLNDEAKAILDAQVERLKTMPDVNVVIAGHTDERGTPEYNIALGQRRADAVKNYLMEKGIKNISTISYGEEQLMALGHTEADNAQNRRAVLEY